MSVSFVEFGCVENIVKLCCWTSRLTEFSNMGFDVSYVINPAPAVFIELNLMATD